ncbi:hypothetical protein OK016_29005 [Vibrio chagasii]|nr:hypothetical protein [Vibrio chagasii]
MVETPELMPLQKLGISQTEVLAEQWQSKENFGEQLFYPKAHEWSHLKG